MGGGVTVGGLRAALAALPGDAPLVVVLSDEDGLETWMDRAELGIVGDPRRRSSYACLSVHVDAKVDWEWRPEGPGGEDDEIPF